MVDESLTNEQLWGENNDSNEGLLPSWSKDVLNNVEQMVILNSIKPIHFKNCFYRGEDEKSQIGKERDVMVMDDVMKRTCKLLKYREDLKEQAEKGKYQQDVFNMDKLKCEILDNSSTNNGSSQVFKHENSKFRDGILTEPFLELTSEASLNVLRSCVSTILAFYGFSGTTMVPLQLLTEVAEDYIKRMAKLLHTNIEKEMLEGESGFSDAFDRACHEMGIGSIRNLTEYYKEETLSLSSKRTKECKEELTIYENIVKKLRDEKRQTSELSLIEMDDEDQVIPELHLTSISDSDMPSKPFEAGLQMLQTLELQQMMNMDLSIQPGCSSSTITVDLSAVKNEFEDVKPFKRKRK